MNEGERRTAQYSRGRPKPLILHIDDSDKILAVTELIFDEIGIDSIGALDAEQGIAKAKAEEPDLILMDVVMPGIDGFEAVKILRKEPITKNIPILMVTGAEEEKDVHQALRAGANGYIVKPIKKERLILKLEEWLELPRIL